MAEPTSDVYNRAYMRNWSGLLKRLETHPQDAAWFKKSNGMTALHFACRRKPPPEVIEALVAAYPDAAARDRSAQRIPAPLILACSHGASFEVLRILLRATPASVMGYKSKRTYCCSRGRMPENPLDYLFMYYSRVYRCNAYRWNVDCAIRSSADLTGKLGEFWQKAALLLDHARRGDANTRQPLDPADPVLILQAAASIKANNFSFSWDVAGLVKRLMSDVPDLISERAHIPGEGGRFLLHTAVDGGLGWEDGVVEIARAAPWVVSVRDEETGLYPFMLAAAAAGAQEEDDSLTVIWRLLLEDPSPISVSSQ